MRRAQGFSLIELMLALALGVVVTAGIVTLFVGNNQTYTLLNGQSRMQENARFALDFITRSARAAGYFGCDPEPAKIYKTLNGAWTQTLRSRHHDADRGVPRRQRRQRRQRLDAVADDAAAPRFGRRLHRRQRHRHHEAAPAKRHPRAASRAGPGRAHRGDRSIGLLNPTVEIPATGLEFAADNFVAINNCEQATVFRIANIAAAGADRDAGA